MRYSCFGLFLFYCQFSLIAQDTAVEKMGLVIKGVIDQNQSVGISAGVIRDGETHFYGKATAT